jgi:hypothetical protein
MGSNIFSRFPTRHREGGRLQEGRSPSLSGPTDAPARSPVLGPKRAGVGFDLGTTLSRVRIILVMYLLHLPNVVSSTTTETMLGVGAVFQARFSLSTQCYLRKNAKVPSVGNPVHSDFLSRVRPGLSGSGRGFPEGGRVGTEHRPGSDVGPGSLSRSDGGRS